MTEKEKYRLLCDIEKNIPLFSQAWWLDIVCGKDNWTVLLAESDDVIEASMPIYSPCSKIICLPYFTQTMGVWFSDKKKELKYSRELYRKQELCKKIIGQIPQYHYFYQNFNHSFTDWLPFYWDGFRQSTNYTYILHNIKNISALSLKENFSDSVKKSISKAQKSDIIVKKNIPLDDFLSIYEKTYGRQGKKPVGINLLGTLIESVKKCNQGEIWGAFDNENQLHAAVFIVWTDNCAYYIAGGGDPLLRNSGAHALVMLEAIQFASTVSDSFDFEGSMHSGIEHFFRGFGAMQTPYFAISKGKLNKIDKVRMEIGKYRDVRQILK